MRKWFWIFRNCWNSIWVFAQSGDVDLCFSDLGHRLQKVESRLTNQVASSSDLRPLVQIQVVQLYVDVKSFFRNNRFVLYIMQNGWRPHLWKIKRNWKLASTPHTACRKFCSIWCFLLPMRSACTLLPMHSPSSACSFQCVLLPPANAFSLQCGVNSLSQASPTKLLKWDGQYSGTKICR